MTGPMTEPCGNCEVCSRCVNADAELHEQFGQLTDERDALRVVSKACRERNEVLVRRILVLVTERDALRVLRAELEATETSHQDEQAAHAETRHQRDIARAQVVNMRAENLASQQVIVDAFAVQHLTELREAAEAYMEAPSDEARGLRLRAVLAKVKP